jgi:hypothetical protein
MTESAIQATSQQNYVMLDILERSIDRAASPAALRRLVKRIDSWRAFAEMHEYPAEEVAEFARLSKLAEERLTAMEQEE